MNAKASSPSDHSTTDLPSGPTPDARAGRTPVSHPAVPEDGSASGASPHVDGAHVDGEGLTRETLIAAFDTWHTPREQWRIGAEWEQFLVRASDGSPAQFEGEDGIESLLQAMVRTGDWTAKPETPGGPLISVERGGLAITLEPGGQFEVAGSPFASMRDVDEEMENVLASLQPLLASRGLLWLPLGFQPFARREEMASIPKLRYPVMRNYLPTRGAKALDMMFRTATVQFNIDYADEADAMRKLRVALRIQPLITAWCTSSPWVETRHEGPKGQRAHVWLDMDPDRTGLLPFAWNEDAGYADYVDWALEAPMFLVRRGNRLIHNAGQTFASFMREGAEGTVATMEDWETHLRTLFPEVRLKRTIELRGADSLPWRFGRGLGVFWKGLLYDADALASADDLTRHWHHEELAQARVRVGEVGADAEIQGQPMWAWLDVLVSQAKEGLARIDGGAREADMLAPLEGLLAQRQSPADLLLRHFGADASVLLPSRAAELAEVLASLDA